MRQDHADAGETVNTNHKAEVSSSSTGAIVPCGGGVLKPSRYLVGSFLYLVGSVLFFASGLGSQRDSRILWTRLADVGNFTFVLGSVVFVYDGYIGALTSGGVSAI